MLTQQGTTPRTLLLGGGGANCYANWKRCCGTRFSLVSLPQTAEITHLLFQGRGKACNNRLITAWMGTVVKCHHHSVNLSLRSFFVLAFWVSDTCLLSGFYPANESQVKWLSLSVLWSRDRNRYLWVWGLIKFSSWVQSGPDFID